MNINDLTIGQAREIAALVNPVARTLEEPSALGISHPWKIGKIYFIRTVTHHYTGRLKAVFAAELVFTDAAWIPDDGRFSDALKSCTFSEVEPFPDGDVIIGRPAVLDAVEVLDAAEISNLQRNQK